MQVAFVSLSSLWFTQYSPSIRPVFTSIHVPLETSIFVSHRCCRKDALPFLLTTSLDYAHALLLSLLSWTRLVWFPTTLCITIYPLVRLDSLLREFIVEKWWHESTLRYYSTREGETTVDIFVSFFASFWANEEEHIRKRSTHRLFRDTKENGRPGDPKTWRTSRNSHSLFVNCFLQFPLYCASVSPGFWVRLRVAWEEDRLFPRRSQSISHSLVVSLVLNESQIHTQRRQRYYQQ